MSLRKKIAFTNIVYRSHPWSGLHSCSIAMLYQTNSTISSAIWWWGYLTLLIGVIAISVEPTLENASSPLSAFFSILDGEKHVKWYQFFEIILMVLVSIGIVEHLYYGVSGFPMDDSSYYRPNMFFFILGIVIALLRLGISILVIKCAQAYRLELMQNQLQNECVVLESGTAYHAYQPPKQYGQSTEHVV